MAKEKIKIYSFLFAVAIAFIYCPKAMAQGAVLRLEPDSGSFEIDKTIKVDIYLNTGGAETDGVDIYYLRYPSSALEVIDEDTAKPGIQIKPGALYAITASNNVIPNEGRINFSQVSAGGQRFKGEGILATINFKVKGSGTAPLSFDFTPGLSFDCNVASVGQDILAETTGATFTLGGEPSSVPLPVVEPTKGGPPILTEPPITIEPKTEPALGGFKSWLAEKFETKTILWFFIPLILALIVILIFLEKHRRKINNPIL